MEVTPKKQINLISNKKENEKDSFEKNKETSNIGEDKNDYSLSGSMTNMSNIINNMGMGKIFFKIIYF
jgi:hypothetical protein